MGFNLELSYSFITSLSTGSLIVRQRQSQMRKRSRKQWSPNMTHRIAWLTLGSAGTTKTEWRTICKITMTTVIICSQEGVCEQALVFTQGPSLTACGSMIFLLQHSIMASFVILTGNQLQQQYKMHIQKESVVNFLTPTKLITTSFRPKTKAPSNQPQYTHSSHKLKPALSIEDSSKNYNSQYNKLNQQLMRSQEKMQTFRGKQIQAHYENSHVESHKYALQNTSKTILNSQHNNKINDYQKIQMRGEPEEYMRDSAIKIYKVQNSIPLVQQQVLVKSSNKSSRVSEYNTMNAYNNMNQNEKIRDSQHKAEMLKQSKAREDNHRQFYVKDSFKEENTKDYKVNTSDLLILVERLKGVKKMIETSLKDLKTLLDSTSKFLNNIDDEYLKIKTRIMDYTSKVLDIGFTKYKQNMVSWAQYEKIEAKAVMMDNKLQDNILQDSIYLQELSKMNNNSKLCRSKQSQLMQKIELYNIFAADLQASRAECLNMRPQIKKERLSIFEEALTHLAAF